MPSNFFADYRYNLYIDPLTNPPLLWRTRFAGSVFLLRSPSPALSSNFIYKLHMLPPYTTNNISNHDVRRLLPIMSSFIHLQFQAADEFNDLRSKLAADSDPNKVDVSAGVYRDESGASYTLPSIVAAKRLLQENDGGHDYNFCLGISDFVSAAAKVAVGEKPISQGLVSSCQTIGGTGACHLGAEFLAQYCGFDQFYLGIPAWPNYFPLLKHVGAKIHTYDYYDAEKKAVNFDGLLKTLHDAPIHSVFILQLCCHNPTASDLTLDQWNEVGEIMKLKSQIAFFDAAYQGFASGSIEKDGEPIRRFIDLGVEVLVAQSFSKNLGLYGERVGCLHVVSKDSSVTPMVTDQLRYILRAESSSTPAFGARLASIIANDPKLSLQWKNDVIEISERLKDIRAKVFSLLTEKYKTPGTWDHIKTQKGLFWYSGITPAQATKLISDHHIYLTKSGRVNVAGLNEKNTDLFCYALDRVIRE